MATWFVLPLFGALSRPGAKTRRAKILIEEGGVSLEDEATHERVFDATDVVIDRASADAGSYCVQLFDNGTLREDTAFSVTIEHP